MKFGPYFAMLIDEFEAHKGERLVTKAYLDSGGTWTGPGGAITNLDGSPVREGQTWTKAEALTLFSATKTAFASEVEELISEGVMANLKQYQFDALGFFAWNIGVDAFGQSTALKKLNMGRFEEAAGEMLRWRYDTLYGGSIGPDGKPARDPNGKVMPEGQRWVKAFRGLLRRQAWTALLLMGRWGAHAASLTAIKLHSYPTFNEEEQEWRDVITSESTWDDILAAAKDDPLPVIASAEPETPPQQEEAKPMETFSRRTITLPENWDTLTHKQRTAWLNGDEEKALKEALVVGRKKIVEVPNIPTRNEKPMEESETHRGLAKKSAGKESVGTGVSLTALATGSAAMAGLSDTAKKTMENTTGLIGGVTLKDLAIIAFIAGGLLLVFGLWRWWRGSIIAYEGRQAATQPKV